MRAVTVRVPYGDDGSWGYVTPGGTVPYCSMARNSYCSTLKPETETETEKETETETEIDRDRDGEKERDKDRERYRG